MRTTTSTWARARTTSSRRPCTSRRSTRLVHDLLPALEALAATLAGEGERVRRRRQVGPHALDGRGAGHARPGVRRLRRAGARGPGARRSRRSSGSARSRSAAPPSAPGSTRIRSSRRASARSSPPTPASTISAARRSVRVPGGARRARRGLGRAEDARGQPDEDRERPALPRLRPARRPRRDLPAGAAEGLVDHARQGQPGHPRGRDAGRRPGDRQRPGDRGRRHAGPLRAERLRAADGAEPARVDQAARRRLAACSTRSASRDRGEPRAVRALRRADAVGGDRAQPVHRLRQGAPRSSRRPRRRAGRCARSRATRASTTTILDEALDYRKMAKPHDA